MEQYYSDERNVQILVALLKEHGIKKIVVSPGSTNVTFVGSVQQDSWFELYSCVDERSAAYMAVGLARESREPVVLSCTGATASRNYFPALTEAYYRQIPVLAVTSTQEESKIGNLVPQVLDRTVQPNDLVKLSVHLETVKDEDDAWDVNLKANKAILELNHHGKGPVHINLTTRYSKNFMVKTLPAQRKIERITPAEKFPALLPKGKIAVYVGTHAVWTAEETAAVDRFCESHNAFVMVDTASNYNGKYRINASLAWDQQNKPAFTSPDLLIHIGQMSDMAGNAGQPKYVWRVAEDGLLSDRYHRLTKVFEMPELSFFKHYATDQKSDMSYFKQASSECQHVLDKVPELPFSHIWIASQLAGKFPKESVLHLGILAPLRSWSYFPIDKNIEVECNEGGFGIDGNASTLIGSSLAHPDKLHFGVVGDLSFFYDLNSLGNRHVGRNVRILLINNSLGEEFLLFKQLNCIYVRNVQKYIAAEGHFGHKSPDLVRHYATDLGYEYMSAWSKEDFAKCYERFITPELTDKPMIFECFTNPGDENEALHRMWSIENTPASLKREAKQAVKSIIGKDNIQKVKDIVKILEK